MISLSVAIITYNEEARIGACLEAVKDIADEILVLDSHSTDRTRTICEENGATVMLHSFDGHIQQKNRALAYTSHPYVLSIDADEILTPELKTSISRVKHNWTHDGYYVNRIPNYCGQWIQHGGWYPDKKLRLIDKRKGAWKGLNPHDRLELREGTTSSGLEGNLLHYSFASVEEHVLQVAKFSVLAAKAAHKEGKQSNIFKICSHPFWKFVRDYFLRLGFLDGYYGFIIAMISAYAKFLKYVELKEYTNQIN